jgi:microcystin-dependent protein
MGTSSTGGGTPHNIMPPFLALNYIIKTSMP